MSEFLQLNFPCRSYVGPGCIERLGGEAASLGSHALLVTGRSALRSAGITDRLVALLEGAGLSVSIFDQAPPEPDIRTVDGAREMINTEGCDLVVEAGGGSAIDVGKAAAALAGEELPTGDYQRGRQITSPGLPHIAVATTSGTGSEVTKNSVLTDRDRQLKQSIRADGVMPRVSFTDAELTLSCPPHVTAASGMDALAQAIESFFSVHAVPTTEALSLGAVELIVPSLEVAVAEGDNIGARAALAEGSFMAGLALASARLGAVHGMAHPIGLFYELPHGVVCAALLPPVLKRNAEAAPEKHDRLRKTIGKDPLECVQDLRDVLNLPRVLGRLPDDESMAVILDYTLKSGSSRANPAPVTEDYVRAVLAEVCTQL